MVNFIDSNGNDFFECNPAEARLAKKAVLDSRMDAVRKKDEKITIADMYLHVGNGGISFTVNDTDCGPEVNVSLGFFGHNTNISFFPAVSSLETLAHFFLKVSTYPFKDSYCEGAQVHRIEYNEKLFVDSPGYISMELERFQHMFYPQYGEGFENDSDKTILKETWEWLQEQSKLRLSESPDSSVKVIEHWKSIAAGNIPFGFKIRENTQIEDEEAMVKILPDYNGIRAACLGKSEGEQIRIVRKELIKAIEKLDI